MQNTQSLKSLRKSQVVIVLKMNKRLGRHFKAGEIQMDTQSILKITKHHLSSGNFKLKLKCKNLHK
jgi:hypothetical protein